MNRISKPKLNQGINGDEELKHNPYALRRLREKLGSIRMPRPKAKATAAFLFLPQFRTSFEGISHLYPILVRMIAVLFAECRLIPPNHPALNYRRPEEKTHYSFKKLVGEAWFTLKTTRATTYQWSMFAAVTMMVVTLIGSVGAFFGRVMLGVGSVAQAQMFDAFQNKAAVSPYPLSACATDFTNRTSINCGTQSIGAPPAGSIFDSRINGQGISTDYALMVLDKVLRQSMANTPNGGAMQNALSSLMMVYNSGMLVVACVMIGWMVISLMIDTAKTGTVGGGRHNMVWLPVRVIFALGIMFPIGSVGYSGGQYMVVKLAEWGSNFGTAGWARYVSSVVGNRQLLAPYSVKNATNIVNGMTKVMVCQVAYNTYVRQRTGLLDPQQIITAKQDLPAGANLYIRNRYTNDANTNVCGTISYGSNFADDHTKQLNWDPTSDVTSQSPMSGSTPRNSHPANVYKNAGLATAATDYRAAMRPAVEATLQEGSAAINAARTFACQFVARRFHTGNAASAAGNPVADIGVADAAGNPAAVPQCAGVTAAAADPTMASLVATHQAIQTAMMTAFISNGRPALENYIGTSTASPMITEMTKRGWAGMGMWYQDIVTLNSIMLSAQQPPATIEAGGAWIGQTGPGWEDRCGSGSAAGGENCKFPGIADKVMQVMSDYDRWWDISSMVTDPAKGAAKPANQANEEIPRAPGQGVMSVISSIASMAYGDNGLFNVFFRLLFPRSTNTFIFKAVDLQATNTYPLTQLADTGHSILGIGLGMWTVISIFQAVSTIDAAFSAGKGLAFSALMQVLASLGTVMIMAGIAISFYLPALPFLRVAFAVLTWITSVFEAVVMVPVAALTHLSTTGPGLLGQHGRIAWVLWFNVFMRPILVVFGFIAGMLIFNTFAVYFHTTFSQGAATIMNSGSLFSPAAHISKICYSVVYLSTLYSVANATFKLMDVLPNHLMRWMGDWGSGVGGPQNMDPGPVGRGMTLAGKQVMSQIQQAIPGRFISEFRSKSVDWDGSMAQASLSRAANMGVGQSDMSAAAAKQRAADQLLTISRMSGKEREEYQKLGDQYNKDRYLQHKFLEQENKRYKRFFTERGIGFSAVDTKKRGFQANIPGVRLDYHAPFGEGHNVRNWAGMMNPLNWSASGKSTTIGAIFQARIAGLAFEDGSVSGHGRFGHKDNNQHFRELGAPGIAGASGQIAGATFKDKDFDKALEMGNTTHTSDWDDMSSEQREMTTRKILATLSSADALNYARMSGEAQNDFVQSYYKSNPEEFAPGVGKKGVDKMVDYLKDPNKLQDSGNMSDATKMMRLMTTAEKAEATRRYLKWEQDSGRPSDPSMLMGQMATKSFTDRALDAVMGYGQQTMDDVRSNRWVTMAARKFGKVQNEIDDVGRAQLQELAKYDMTGAQQTAYAKGNNEQKRAMEKIVAELKLAEKAWEDNQLFSRNKDTVNDISRKRERAETMLNMIVADINSKSVVMGTDRSTVMMTIPEKRAYDKLTDNADREKFEKLMLKRRLYSKQLAKRQITSAEYFKKVKELKKEIRYNFTIK